MKTIQITGIDYPDFKADLLNDLKSQLGAISTPEINNPLTDYIGIQDLASALGVSKVTIFNWQKSGKLQPYKIGRRTFFKISEITEAIKPVDK